MADQTARNHCGILHVSRLDVTMRATKFEFEQRFWIIGAIFWVGFGLYQIDHTNFAVWLLHVLAPSVNPDSDHGNNLLRIIFAGGALLVFSAAALRTWATAYLRTEVVHDMSQHSDSIVADGPYRYVRNPLYLANLPMVAGMGTLASRLGWMFMVGAMWVFVYRLILREEDGLRREQGETYGRYLIAVPRFWPSLSSRVPASGAKPQWRQAFAGESLIWLFGVAVLCFAVTLNFKITVLVLLLSFAVYFIAVYLAKKQATART